MTSDDLAIIDGCLLRHTSTQWLKVARVVLDTWEEIGDRYPGLPDEFYPSRIQHLAESGKIEIAGDPVQMRFSEVRLSDRNST